jgi:hypothetical protein
LVISGLFSAATKVSDQASCQGGQGS